MSELTFGLLDNDFYQFTMGQAIWKHYRDVKVRYRFRNRTFGVPLASRISIKVISEALREVRDEYEQVDSSDIAYLRDTGLFEEEYLVALQNLKLPDFVLRPENGHLFGTYEGDWWQGVFWETPFLYAISDCYYNRFGPREGTPEGEARLIDKIRYLQENSHLRFAEMGTRRRYSREWQRHVLDVTASEVPEQLIGTSNVYLAREFDLKPIGTMAHQMFMVTAAQEVATAQTNGDEPHINGAQQEVLDVWESLYGDHPEMMTFLPDTYGTEFFLSGMAKERMALWQGIRQDSGDPLDICARVIRWWRANGIDPKTKKLLPSDGLDLRRMSLLHDAFSDVTNIAFGIGTNWTNDLGYEPLSIVVKPDAVFHSAGEGYKVWNPCVKISDAPAKATGLPEMVAYYKNLVGYDIDSHDPSPTKY